MREHRVPGRRRRGAHLRGVERRRFRAAAERRVLLGLLLRGRRRRGAGPGVPRTRVRGRRRCGLLLSFYELQVRMRVSGMYLYRTSVRNFGLLCFGKRNPF